MHVDMLTELSRREKASNIKPDPDLDVFMKVKYHTFTIVAQLFIAFPKKVINFDKFNFLLVSNLWRYLYFLFQNCRQYPREAKK
jgi:hypothetical protein